MRYKIYTSKKGVYLASRLHRLKNLNIDYNDIVNYPGINLCCDMLEVDLILKVFLHHIHIINFKHYER